jgi:hypothetical protein
MPGNPMDNVGNLAGQGFRYLFRGTTKGFSGGKTALSEGVTYTSLDPLKSTIFAIAGKGKGEAVLHSAKIGDLTGTGVRAGNWAAEREAEVILEMLPMNFVEKAKTVTLSQARQIFDNMGIKVPSSVNNIDEVLRNTPDLTKKQIGTFYEEVNKLNN